MIVLDSSVAVAALTGHSPARQVVAAERLVAPAVIDVEVAHALRGLVRKGTCAAAQGGQLLATFAELAIDRVPMTGLLGRVWQLSENLTAYDAVFVALAEAHELALVTCDSRLARAPGLRCTVQLLPVGA